MVTMCALSLTGNVSGRLRWCMSLGHRGLSHVDCYSEQRFDSCVYFLEGSERQKRKENIAKTVVKQARCCSLKNKYVRFHF